MTAFAKKELLRGAPDSLCRGCSAATQARHRRNKPPGGKKTRRMPGYANGGIARAL